MRASQWRWLISSLVEGQLLGTERSRREGSHLDWVPEPCIRVGDAAFPVAYAWGANHQAAIGSSRFAEHFGIAKNLRAAHRDTASRKARSGVGQPGAFPTAKVMLCAGRSSRCSKGLRGWQRTTRTLPHSPQRPP